MVVCQLKVPSGCFRRHLPPRQRAAKVEETASGLWRVLEDAELDLERCNTLATHIRRETHLARRGGHAVM